MTTKFDAELAQRSADWLTDRSGDAGRAGYGPLAAEAMRIDYRLGQWESVQTGRDEPIGGCGI